MMDPEVRGAAEGLRPVVEIKVEKFADEEALAAGIPSEVVVVEGNVALTEGIWELLKLLIGSGGTIYSNTNARIGVGNSTTAADASQTGLLGSSKAWKGMDSGFPIIGSDQKSVQWRATFQADEALFSWSEFTVVNAANDAGANLNRKISVVGTKGSVPWRATITLSFT